MNKKQSSMVLLSSLLAVSLSLISSPFAMVWASSNGDDFREIKKADIGIKDDIIKTIFFKTRGEIPTDGSGGAFGYGVVLSNGKAVVTTTHAGVLDSEKQQGEILNPIWHNHYVKLAENEVCENEGFTPPLAVAEITFESPGKVIIDENTALLKDLPEKADTLLLGGGNSFIKPGADVAIVASFSLVPLIDLVEQNPPVTVCIDDIQDVPEEYINEFEIKNHYGYGSEEYYPSSYEERHDYRGEYHEKDYRNNYDNKEHRR